MIIVFPRFSTHILAPLFGTKEYDICIPENVFKTYRSKDGGVIMAYNLPSCCIAKCYKILITYALLLTVMVRR